MAVVRIGIENNAMNALAKVHVHAHTATQTPLRTRNQFEKLYLRVLDALSHFPLE